MKQTFALFLVYVYMHIFPKFLYEQMKIRFFMRSYMTSDTSPPPCMQQAFFSETRSSVCAQVLF